MPDLDPEPVPAHGFRPRPLPVTDHADLLPRRHRGRTLAEAEAEAEAAAEAAEAGAARPQASAAAPGTGPDLGPDDVMSRAARFNNFRQAVRHPAADEPAQARTSPATPHPEGDPPP